MFQPLYVAATGLTALEEELLNVTNVVLFDGQGL